jgi:alpha-galactosidase
MKRFTIFLFTVLSFSVSAQKFDNLAKTPPMGWNSWNKFRCTLNEQLIREIADAMVSSGMKDAGYHYVVLDDCWQSGRDSLGNIIPDAEKFPSGMKSLGDYIHSKGLKFGIYSCAGSMTCQKKPGSRDFQKNDAQSYAAWGVDYLKYDYCFAEDLVAKDAYKIMSDALKATGRPIVFSICECGEFKPWLWGREIGHLWRTTEDIRDVFKMPEGKYGMGVLDIIDAQAGLSEYAGPGHWNDADMLEVGNGGMTNDEYKTHFSMWAMMTSPLIAGNDIRNMNETTRGILLNKDIIAIDQDGLGNQAVRIQDSGDSEVWMKKLSGGEMAVCFLNRADKVWNLKFNWKNNAALSDKSSAFNKDVYEIFDCWEHQTIGKTSQELQKNIPAHGILVVRLKKSKT